MKPLTFTFVLTLTVLVSIPALGMSVEEVPNPQETRGEWVSDTASVISEADEQTINATIDALEEETGTEIAVVTVEQVDAPTPKDFATELFNHWGIGKAGDDNGLLLLLDLGERRIEMETGYGTEAVLTDGWLKRMQQEEMVPAFKAERYGAGLVAGVDASVERLLAYPDAIGTSEAARAAAPADDSGDGDMPWAVTIIIIVCSIMLMIVFAVLPGGGSGGSSGGSSFSTSSSTGSSGGGGSFGGGSSGGGGSGSSF